MFKTRTTALRNETKLVWFVRQKFSFANFFSLLFYFTYTLCNFHFINWTKTFSFSFYFFCCTLGFRACLPHLHSLKSRKIFVFLLRRQSHKLKSSWKIKSLASRFSFLSTSRLCLIFSRASRARRDVCADFTSNFQRMNSQSWSFLSLRSLREAAPAVLVRSASAFPITPRTSLKTRTSLSKRL